MVSRAAPGLLQAQASPSPFANSSEQVVMAERLGHQGFSHRGKPPPRPETKGRETGEPVGPTSTQLHRTYLRRIEPGHCEEFPKRDSIECEEVRSVENSFERLLHRETLDDEDRWLTGDQLQWLTDQSEFQRPSWEPGRPHRTPIRGILFRD
jgi:hypothetical protein